MANISRRSGKLRRPLRCNDAERKNVSGAERRYDILRRQTDLGKRSHKPLLRRLRQHGSQCHEGIPLSRRHDDELAQFLMEQSGTALRSQHERNVLAHQEHAASNFDHEVHVIRRQAYRSLLRSLRKWTKAKRTRICPQTKINRVSRM